MIQMVRFLKSRFTMKYPRVLFWDRVNGKAVCLYTDCYGIEWMAQSKFGLRTKRKRT